MVDTKAYVVEAVGTMFLCFHSYTSGFADSTGMVCGYMALMILAAKLSGGHFNPGITIGMLVAGKCSPKNFGLYMLSQFIGSILAAVLYQILTGWYGRVPSAFDINQMWQLFLLFLVAQIAITVVYLLIATGNNSPKSAFSFCVPLTQLFVNSFTRFNSYKLLGNCVIYMGNLLFNQSWGTLLAAVFGCLGGGAIGGLLHKHFLSESA